MTTEIKTIRMTIRDSAEVFTAPDGLDEKAAVLWLGRLVHPTIHRIDRQEGHRYHVSNGRRGVASRGTRITICDE